MITTYTCGREVFEPHIRWQLTLWAQYLRVLLMPFHHRALEAWSGQDLEGKNNIIIPADSTPAEIGAALKLAFSRYELLTNKLNQRRKIMKINMTREKFYNFIKTDKDQDGKISKSTQHYLDYFDRYSGTGDKIKKTL